MSNDQAQTLRNGLKESRPIRVLAVASGKGGVGKTNASVNLSVSLSQMGQRVLLMDADMGLANVDVLLGLKTKFNLAHVLDGQCDLRDAMVTGPGGVQIIPAASGVKRMASLTPQENAGIIQAFDELSGFMDVLIIDTAAGIADSVLSFCRAAQEVLVVVCDEPASITDAYALIKVLSREYKVTRFKVIANMAQNEGMGRQLFEKLSIVSEKFLDVNLEYLGTVPFDYDLRKAVQNQTPVVLQSPNSEAARAYKAMAEQIVNWPINPQATGYLQFFMERLLGEI